MSVFNWYRPSPKEYFSPERLFMSTSGLHYSFINRRGADRFYHSCVAKGNRGIVLSGTQVIDTRYRLSE